MCMQCHITETTEHWHKYGVPESCRRWLSYDFIFTRRSAVGFRMASGNYRSSRRNEGSLCSWYQSAFGVTSPSRRFFYILRRAEYFAHMLPRTVADSKQCHRVCEEHWAIILSSRPISVVVTKGDRITVAKMESLFTKFVLFVHEATHSSCSRADFENAFVTVGCYIATNNRSCVCPTGGACCIRTRTFGTTNGTLPFTGLMQHLSATSRESFTPKLTMQSGKACDRGPAKRSSRCGQSVGTSESFHVPHWIYVEAGWWVDWRTWKYQSASYRNTTQLPGTLRLIVPGYPSILCTGNLERKVRLERLLAPPSCILIFCLPDEDSRYRSFLPCRELGVRDRDLVACLPATFNWIHPTRSDRSR